MTVSSAFLKAVGQASVHAFGHLPSHAQSRSIPLVLGTCRKQKSTYCHFCSMQGHFLFLESWRWCMRNIGVWSSWALSGLKPGFSEKEENSREAEVVLPCSGGPSLAAPSETGQEKSAWLMREGPARNAVKANRALCQVYYSSAQPHSVQCRPQHCPSPLQSKIGSKSIRSCTGRWPAYLPSWQQAVGISGISHTWKQQGQTHEQEEYREQLEIMKMPQKIHLEKSSSQDPHVRNRLMVKSSQTWASQSMVVWNFTLWLLTFTHPHGSGRKFPHYKPAIPRQPSSSLPRVVTTQTWLH